MGLKKIFNDKKNKELSSGRGSKDTVKCYAIIRSSV